MLTPLAQAQDSLPQRAKLTRWSPCAQRMRVCLEPTERTSEVLFIFTCDVLARWFQSVPAFLLGPWLGG